MLIYPFTRPVLFVDLSLYGVRFSYGRPRVCDQKPSSWSHSIHIFKIAFTRVVVSVSDPDQVRTFVAGSGSYLCGRTDQVRTFVARSGSNLSGRIRFEPLWPDQVRTCVAGSGSDRCGRIRFGPVWPDQVRTCVAGSGSYLELE